MTAILDTTDPVILAARQCPAGLASYHSKGKWQIQPHLARLDAALRDAITNPGRRIVVEMPPRHGKSMLTSQYATAWAAMQSTDTPVLLASYEASFASTWGQKSRDVVAEVGPSLFGVRVHPDIGARDDWRVQRYDGRAWQTTEAGMATAGIGGALTGKGGRLIVIDDPIKNYEEAQSKSARDRVWDWYRSVAYTRLEPGGSVVIVMTRWHEDDLVGRVLSNEDEEDYEPDWQVIKMPAFSLGEDKDPLGRPKGAALWPARYPAKRLKGIHASIGPMLFSCLFQQDPTPEGGTVFRRKHFRYYRDFGDYVVLYPNDGSPEIRYPKQLLVTQTYVDPALGEKQQNDPSVILTALMTPGGHVLVDDVLVDRVQSPEVKAYIRENNLVKNPAKIGVESTAYQASIIQDLQREGLPIVPLDGIEGNKFSRAVTAATRLQQGRAYFKADAPWLGAFERELTRYPNTAHDDQVDTLGFALADSVGRGATLPSARVTAAHDNVLTVNF